MYIYFLLCKCNKFAGSAEVHQKSNQQRVTDKSIAIYLTND